MLDASTLYASGRSLNGVIPIIAELIFRKGDGMKRTFERFTGSHAPLNKVPSVTIQKRGMLSLNRAAYDLLKRPQAVQLYFSANEQAIGITPSDPKAPDAIIIRKQKSSASYIIAGMAFTKWYGIDSSSARRYEATAEGEELYVDLK
jgi:hypothetical protein